MADYKETSLTAKRWKRANRVQIENPIGEGKRITFHEEMVTLLSDDTYNNQPAGNTSEVFADPAAAFPLRDPSTGLLIEGRFATYGDVYVLLHSLYMHLAEKRDDEEAARVAELPPE